MSVFLAPQNIPRAISVLTVGNKVILYIVVRPLSPCPQKGKTAAVVDRLTDTSKYTGSHQARFDESGKGKGKEGREDIVENKGYVGNYKGEGTFGKK